MIALYVTAGDTVNTAPTDHDLASIVRPWYLQDLQGDDIGIDSFYSVNINQDGMSTDICGFWLGAGRDCEAVDPGGDLIPAASYADCPFEQFAGSRGEHPEAYWSANKLVTYDGAVNEWSFFGLGSAFHPLHIHVNHFQVHFFPATSCITTPIATILESYSMLLLLWVD